MKRALERHDAGEANLIGIVVRPCNWQETNISRLQAVPKDALAITAWENQDSAWTDAAKRIKDHLNSFTPKPSLMKGGSTQKAPSKHTIDWLEDTEIKFAHRRINNIKLRDIYVTPDIEKEKTKDIETVTIESASRLQEEPGFYLLSGEEQQGKTSFLKHIYEQELRKGKTPIYIDARLIKKSSASDILEKLIAIQYKNFSFEDFSTNKENLILLDNIDEFGLNQKFRNLFLEEINNISNHIIATCHTSFIYVTPEIPPLDNYNKTTLLGLGNKKRDELVQKWVGLGIEESIDEKELYAQCDDFETKLNLVIKKNIVPPKPIYVLILLQMFEANSQLNLELTSYGHCYQQLIYQSFEKANINRTDYEKYLNVLTELSWWIFKEEKEPNEDQLDRFFEEYSEKYLSVDQKSVIGKLVNHSILSKNNFRTGFKYPYIYYFFVGKKIAESYGNSEDVKNSVRALLKDLHREDFANILIFITHHTKEPWVLEEINQVLSELFKDQRPATLRKDQLKFMEDFMKGIPELVIEQREIQKERDKHNEELDQIERKGSTGDSSDNKEQPDIFFKINKTFKGMEIAGQIIRNRHASLTRTDLFALGDSGISTGLRFLDYFIEISDSAKKEIVNFIASNLSEHPSLSDKEIEKKAEDTYIHITYGVINSTINKIASSIGSKEASEIYRLLEQKGDTPAHSLIRQSIELQFGKKLSIENVKKCSEKIKGNAVATRILKEMVIRHIYMFPVDYREKQQLSSLLNISIKGQRLLDQRSRGKGAR